MTKQIILIIIILNVLISCSKITNKISLSQYHCKPEFAEINFIEEKEERQKFYNDFIVSKTFLTDLEILKTSQNCLLETIQKLNK